MRDPDADDSRLLGCSFGVGVLGVAVNTTFSLPEVKSMLGVCRMSNWLPTQKITITESQHQATTSHYLTSIQVPVKGTTAWF